MRGILALIVGIGSYYGAEWILEKIGAFILSIGFIENLLLNHTGLLVIALFIFLLFVYGTAYSVSFGLMAMIRCEKYFPVLIYTIVLSLYFAFQIYITATSPYFPIKFPYYIILGLMILWTILQCVLAKPHKALK